MNEVPTYRAEFLKSNKGKNTNELVYELNSFNNLLIKTKQTQYCY